MQRRSRADQYKSHLFNFSASYSGGGLKRLLAYSKWFDENGGARFVVSPRLRGIEQTFPTNTYHFLQQSSFARAINYFGRLKALLGDNRVDLYYSYGIPLPGKLGRVNWFHLSNVLPLLPTRSQVPLRHNLKFQLLRFLTKRSLRHADVLSGESESSVRLFERSPHRRLVVSVNGSDDEIHAHQNRVKTSPPTDNVAIAVGTFYYKSIDDVYAIYRRLRESSPHLRLIIIGVRDFIPKQVLADPLVEAAGVLTQAQVVDWLKRAKYYITCSVIENSYNAASEGAYLAEESFISDIDPHRELLRGVRFRVLADVDTRVPSLHVKRSELTLDNVRSWDQVIGDMLDVADERLKAVGRS